MPIKQEARDDRVRYVLSDEGTVINIEIVPDEEPVAHVTSDDVDFLDLAEWRSGHADPSRDEVLGVMAARLDFVLEQVSVDAVAEDRVTFTLSDNSVMIVGERWNEQPTQLYPENT